MTDIWAREWIRQLEARIAALEAEAKRRADEDARRKAGKEVGNG